MGAPSKRRLSAAAADAKKRQDEADAQAAALEATRNRAGRRGVLGFIPGFDALQGKLGDQTGLDAAIAKTKLG